MKHGMACSVAVYSAANIYSLYSRCACSNVNFPLVNRNILFVKWNKLIFYKLLYIVFKTIWKIALHAFFVFIT